MPPREVQSIRVALRALDESHLFSGIPDYKVKSDGSFVIKNVPEGVYAQVFTGSWDCFLKSVRYGTSNVTDSGLAVHPGSDASLELTMSWRAARGEGVVVNADSLPAAGVYVVLIPDVQHRDDNRKYGLETTDQNGKFTLRGIIPGSYTVFCWDSAEDFDWYDPDMVKPYEGRGIAVSVTEGDHKSVQLTVIERIKSPQVSQLQTLCRRSELCLNPPALPHSFPPCATLSAPIGGEPHADARGRLETAVRVHRFGELAQTYAGGGGVCARVCAQSRGRRRNVGSGRAAA